jgi:hypothetical protein
MGGSYLATRSQTALLLDDPMLLVGCPEAS